MAIIRNGNRTILLVVDMQVGVLENAWDAQRIIRSIVLAVERARSESVPVVWVQHSDDDLPVGSPAWQIVPQLTPAAGELRIDKHFNSSFEGTPLEQKLSAMGVAHIVLAGAATNWCVRATAYAALERGYDLTLLEDAHTTETIEMEDGTRIEAAGIVRELNIAMTWLSYPGRINRTASAEKVEFNLFPGHR